MKRLTRLVVLITCVLFVIVGCQSKSLEKIPNPIAKPASTPSSSENKEASQARATTQEVKQAGESTQKELTGVDFFIGEWLIWIPGGYAEVKSPDNGDGSVSITRDYVAGVQGNVLTIKKDHTYHWVTPTEVVTGDWEENDDGRIILLNGQFDFDWYVEKTSANEIKFYAFGVEEHGTRIQD